MFFYEMGPQKGNLPELSIANMTIGVYLPHLMNIPLMLPFELHAVESLSALFASISHFAFGQMCDFDMFPQIGVEMKQFRAIRAILRLVVLVILHVHHHHSLSVEFPAAYVTF